MKIIITESTINWYNDLVHIHVHLDLNACMLKDYTANTASQFPTAVDMGPPNTCVLP